MEEKKKREAKPKNEHVIMVREDGKEANVHPAEVENYKQGGYKLKGK